MPASIRNLRRAGVVYRPLAPPVPQVEMAIAYRREEPSAIVTAFVQTVRARTRVRVRRAPRIAFKRLATRVGAHLLHDVGAVELDGLDRDVQLRGDLACSRLP